MVRLLVCERRWELGGLKEHAFISAGGGKKFSDALQKLKVGDKIFAYLGGQGYVGYGEVSTECVFR